MFMQMIQDEIKAIEHPEAAAPMAAKEAKMNVSKAIPDDYIADEDEKFNVHKEIIALTSSIEVIQLKESLEDRFGKLPPTVYDYMCSKVYEHLAAIHQVERFRKNPLETTITLSEKVSSQAQGDKLFERANEISPKIKLAYRQKKITLTIPHLEIQRPLSEIGMMLLESL
jgi:transcription-repair coupling factor (superfamily II helicase)